MATPQEGSRDTGDGLIVSVTPDVCKTPVGSSMVPIPYSITAIQGDDANTVTTVRFTGKRAHNMASLVTKCTGDQPGTGTGIKSGTVGSVCHPKGHSDSVRIRGEWAIRNDDAWWMNNRNTVGKLVYIKSKETFEETPAVQLTQEPEREAPLDGEDDPILAAILGGMARAQEEGLPPGSYQVAQASPQVVTNAATQPRPANPPPANDPRIPNRIARPPAQVLQFPARPAPRPIVPSPTASLPWWSRALRFGLTVITLPLMLSGDTPAHQRLFPYRNREEYHLSIEAYSMLQENPYSEEWAEEVRAWYEQSVAVARARALEEQPEAEAQTRPGNVRIEEDDPPENCQVGRYGSLRGTCAPGKQAHHIVPDYALRYGPRPTSVATDNQRIDGMPSLLDGMAVCLSGSARVTGGEHHAAHDITDGVIAAAGTTGPMPGTTTLGTAQAASYAGITAALADNPTCAAYAVARSRAQMQGLSSDRMVRATMTPPTPGSPAYNALSAGASIQNGQVVMP